MFDLWVAGESSLVHSVSREEASSESAFRRLAIVARRSRTDDQCLHERARLRHQIHQSSRFEVTVSMFTLSISFQSSSIHSATHREHAQEIQQTTRPSSFERGLVGAPGSARLAVIGGDHLSEVLLASQFQSQSFVLLFVVLSWLSMALRCQTTSQDHA